MSWVLIDWVSVVNEKALTPFRPPAGNDKRQRRERESGRSPPVGHFKVVQRALVSQALAFGSESSAIEPAPVGEDGVFEGGFEVLTWSNSCRVSTNTSLGMRRPRKQRCAR